MCGRFALDDRVDEMIADWVMAGNNFEEWTPSWNIPPGSIVPVLLHTALTPGAPPEPRIMPGLWSLIPPWSPEPRLKFPSFNARAETLTTTRSWKGAVPAHRCVIPAQIYYEWTGPKNARVPHVVHAPDNAPLALAGLYSWWRAGPESPWLLTATIITRAAVGEVAAIHDRTPLILPAEFVADWINPAITADAAYVDAVVQAATPLARTLRSYPVAPLRGNSPSLLTPVGPPDGDATSSVRFVEE
ncbi:MAG: SOS response-associated peptidase [Mycetocola sp.]